MSALPLKSYGTAQRAVVRFYRLKDIMQMLFTVKCVQCMTTKGPTKKMLGKQKFASWKCYRPFDSGLRSSRLRFFASGIHKLVEGWNKCSNKLGTYVEKWIHDTKRVYVWSFKQVKIYSYLHNQQYHSTKCNSCSRTIWVVLTEWTRRPTK